MPFSYDVVILGHRGEGVTNRGSHIFEKKLAPREDPYFQGKILPENSLSAFESAFEHGADGIECDVYLSRDGIPMVIHDNELAINVDGYHRIGKNKGEDTLGKVSDFTAEELREKFTIGNDEPIPTLDELIQLAVRHNEKHRKESGANLILNIELKGHPDIAQATYDVVMKYIVDVRCPFKIEDFLFNSFDAHCLEAMKRIDSRMRCALGIPTNELFLGELKMPGWIPQSRIYSLDAKKKLNEVTEKFGIDMVTSDLDEIVLGPLCRDKEMPINLAFCSSRALLEALDKKSHEASWSELQREQKALALLAKFSERYGIRVYYKSDYPGQMKKYLKELEIAREMEIDALVEREKIKGKVFLQARKYPPELVASLHDSLKEYRLGDISFFGDALAKGFGMVLKEELINSEMEVKPHLPVLKS